MPAGRQAGRQAGREGGRKERTKEGRNEGKKERRNEGINGKYTALSHSPAIFNKKYETNGILTTKR